MRKTTIEYSCDRCDRAVEQASELVRFSIERSTRGRRGPQSISMDLCQGCENDLLTTCKAVVPERDHPYLRAMSRTEEVE